MLSIWKTAAAFGLTRPTAAEWVLLLLLGFSLLALKACRDGYVKIWIVGWAALVASRCLEHSLSATLPAPFGAVATQATFVLAAGLLAGAVLLYTLSRNLILPLAVITPLLVGLAGARVLLAPDSVPLRMAVEISYRTVLLTAAIALLYARRGRWHPAAWLVALSLPFLPAFRLA